MARKKGHSVVSFRIPFFRIFYSTTYTILYALELLLLAITPASIIWTSIENRAFQYILMVGSLYVLIALLAIFIYSSRLYTNRTVLAGVGKAYIPVEEGEMVKKVRKMVVKQLERSAIVAWEGRPRNIYGEIYEAERYGVLPADSRDVDHNDYTVGRIIQIDPEYPPWGIVRHAGWSSPSQRDDNEYPDVQFATVIAELPNLIEARAVSLAPSDPLSTPRDGQVIADPAVAELLTRPATMGLRDYIKQLSFLGLINPTETGEVFLRQYEHSRFCGNPVMEQEFSDLMTVFSELLAGMDNLDPAIVEQIREQMQRKEDAEDEWDSSSSISRAGASSPSRTRYLTPLPDRAYSPSTSAISAPSPVTAREDISRAATPYHSQFHENESTGTLSSVVHDSGAIDTDDSAMARQHAGLSSSSVAESRRSLGSVVHYAIEGG